MRKDYKREVAKRIREKRGRGAGSDYRPWITVQDARSGGIRHCPPSIFCQRNHQLLSNHELNWFLVWAFCPGVVEIREQFPLFPRSQTSRISSDLGLKHPCYPDGRTPLVLTTDLLIYIRRRGRLLMRACAIKERKELSDPGVIRTLRIEREYWERRGVRFMVLTDDAEPRRLCNALSSLYFARLRQFEPPAYLPELKKQLSISAETDPFHRACLKLDEVFKEKPGTILNIARQMFARRMWRPKSGLAAFANLLGDRELDTRIPIW